MLSPKTRSCSEWFQLLPFCVVHIRVLDLVQHVLDNFLSYHLRRGVPAAKEFNCECGLEMAEAAPIFLLRYSIATRSPSAGCF